MSQILASIAAIPSMTIVKLIMIAKIFLKEFFSFMLFIEYETPHIDKIIIAKNISPIKLGKRKSVIVFIAVYRIRRMKQ